MYAILPPTKILPKTGNCDGPGPPPYSYKVRIVQQLNLLSYRSTRHATNTTELNMRNNNDTTRRHNSRRRRHSTHDANFQRFRSKLSINRLMINNTILKHRAPKINTNRNSITIFLSNRNRQNLRILMSINSHNLNRNMTTNLRSIRLSSTINAKHSFRQMLVTIQRRTILIFYSARHRLHTLSNLALNISLHRLRTRSLNRNFDTKSKNTVVISRLINRHIMVLTLSYLNLIVSNNIMNSNSLLTNMLNQINSLRRRDVNTITLIVGRIIFRHMVNTNRRLVTNLGNRSNGISNRTLT